MSEPAGPPRSPDSTTKARSASVDQMDPVISAIGTLGVGSLSVTTLLRHPLLWVSLALLIGLLSFKTTCTTTFPDVGIDASTPQEVTLCTVQAVVAGLTVKLDSTGLAIR